MCTICGEERLAGQVWFLIAESHWEDKLKILQWHDEIASRIGLHAACSPAHVEELVVHWMTTGSLDVPFAVAAYRWEQRTGSVLPVLAEPDIRGARQIGELAVHRESVSRALNNNPDSLQVILDELSDTLQREANGAARFESAGWMAPGPLRQM